MPRGGDRGARGGARPGAGRPKGSKSKTGAAALQQLAEKSEKVKKLLKTNVFSGTSHELLMLIYKDTELDIALRLEAAKAAIAYEKPRLSAVQMNANVAITHEEALERLK